jgi:DNA-binding NtrC family response regulator
VAIFPIEVPPLRTHKDDLPDISAHLLARMVHGQRPPPGAEEQCLPGPAALEVLASYDWPGNVRELRNVLERALILGGGHLPEERTLRALLEPSLEGGSDDAGAPAGELHLRTRLDALERELILAALEHSGGKRKDAAALLGIDARNMGYYLRKHGLADVGGGRRGDRGPS